MKVLKFGGSSVGSVTGLHNIKSIAELLGWEYKTVRIPESTKVMVVRFDKFLNFLYPYPLLFQLPFLHTHPVFSHP